MRLAFLCRVLPIFIVLSITEDIGALDNGLALTPPMGWLAWERFVCQTDCKHYPHDCINEDLFNTQAERMLKDGFRKVGYQYVNIDDCWSERRRGSNHQLIAARDRFTNGSILPLAMKIHNLGLKIGLYGSCGTNTCQDYPGQLSYQGNLTNNYYEVDANLFADWQIDSFKYDACYVDIKESHNLCPPMGQALNRTGRPMLFSCSWPAYEDYEKLPTNWTILVERCNLWRAFGDIEDSWSSVLSTIDAFIQKQNLVVQYHGPGHWFDADQLIIGDFGLSLEQERSQMAIWCIWSSPLYMSNDLRHLHSESSKILRNEHAIRINQDPMGIFGLMLLELSGPVQVFVKPTVPLDRENCPSYGLVILNRQTLGNSQYVEFKLRPLLIDLHNNLTQLTPQWSHWSNCPHRAGVKYMVHDLFKDNDIVVRDLGLPDGSIRLRVDPSGSRFIQLLQD